MIIYIVNFAVALQLEVAHNDLLNDIYSFKHELSSIESEDYGTVRATNLVNDKFEKRLSYYTENKEVLSDRELFQLRHAIDSAFFITLSNKYASLYESTLYFHSEDPPYQDITQAIHNHWVARDFKQVDTLNEKFHGHLETNYLLPSDPLPDKEFSTLTVEQSQVTSIDRSHLLNEEYYLVVVSDPGCWFSQNLYSVYERITHSANDLPEYIIWLLPQHSTLTPEKLVELREDYPSINFEIVYRNSDWKDYISFYQVPVIYTVTEGQFSLDVVGWSKDDDKQNLIDLIDVSHFQ